jgi:hypothetical protein
MLNPLRAKSCIVALGNHEDRVWSKPEKYAPVLWPDTLRLLNSMAVEHRRTLKQGDCKNAFCQGILPADEITIVKPPIGDPDAEKDEYWLLKRTLYSLRRSPRHWYNKITGILHNLGLKPNASDPCLFTGNLIDPSDPAIAPSTVHITLGIYVDDSPTASPSVVRSKCRKLVADQGVDLIIVDYLQLMSPDKSSKDSNRVNEVSEISRGLKALARELDVPVIALSQLSRMSEYRESGEPRLSDLRDSGAIEQDADLVLMLWRKTDPDFLAASEVVSCKIAKHRNGATGACDLEFIKNTASFRG